ncbi:hypothetical protein HYU95_05320 [Candidatus Daviesbacteria bacterium]|nr:hypothetical protein [Candidatus Daviesbacteria bacterium]
MASPENSETQLRGVNGAAQMGEAASQVFRGLEVKQEPSLVVKFFRTKDGETWCTPALDYHNGPRNACLVIGISENPSRSVRVAYGRLGGNITHAVLESQAAPVRTDYLPVKATLSANVLEIISPSRQEKERMEEVGHKHPNDLLSADILRVLCNLLNAKQVRYVMDRNGEQSIISSGFILEFLGRGQLAVRNQREGD